MHRHRCQNRMFYVDNTASIIARLSAQYGVCMFCACQNAISRMGVSENGYCACVALVCMCEIEKLSVRCRTQYFVLFFFFFFRQNKNHMKSQFNGAGFFFAKFACQNKWLNAKIACKNRRPFANLLPRTTCDCNFLGLFRCHFMCDSDNSMNVDNIFNTTVQHH